MVQLSPVKSLPAPRLHDTDMASTHSLPQGNLLVTELNTDRHALACRFLRAGNWAPVFSINVAVIVVWSVFQFGFGFVFAVKRLVTNVSGEHHLAYRLFHDALSMRDIEV